MFPESLWLFVMVVSSVTWMRARSGWTSYRAAATTWSSGGVVAATSGAAVSRPATELLGVPVKVNKYLASPHAWYLRTGR